MGVSDEKSAAVYQALADDPDSELNQLRREVRRLQGELRSAQLAAAAQADEIIDVRKENEALEARLASERSRVRNTMAAAEALVTNLRRLESEELEEDELQEYPEDDVPTVHTIDDGAGARSHAGIAGAAGDGGRQPSPSPAAISADLAASGLENAGSRGLAVVREDAGAPSPANPASIVVHPARASGLFAAAFSPSQSPKASPVASPAASSSVIDARPPVADSEGLPAMSLASAAGVTNSHPHALTGPTAEEALPASAGHGDNFASLQSINLSFTCASAHEGDIMCAATTVDGQLVASGGDDRTVFLFDLGMRKPLGRLTESNRAVTSLAFEASGRVLAGGSYDGFLRFWRKAETGRRRGRWALSSVLPGHSARVSRVVYDATAPQDAPRLFSASADRTIKLTDCAVGKRPFVATSPSAALDMDIQGATTVISGHKDGGLRIWDVNDKGAAPAFSAKVHDRPVTTVCCLEDGFGVVTLGREGLLKLSDVRQLGETVREMDGGVKVVSDWHRATLYGRTVACGLGPSGTVAHWNVDSGKMLSRKIVATTAPAASGDVLELLKRNPGAVVQPLWTPRCLVLAHKTSQLSIWQ